MPGLKTQAQFTAFRAGFDAFRAVMTAILDGDSAKELEARKILDMTFTATRQATEIGRQLADVPEAATSKAAEDFKRPPAEFQEHDIQQQLLAELRQQGDLNSLKEWYESTKERRDLIRTQILRNVLIDAIRARNMELTPS